LSGSIWAQDREKGKDSQKKSQSGNISLIWEESFTVPIETKIRLAGNLADVITYAKFQDDICKGYNFTRDRISHFLLIFLHGPYNSAALLRFL